LAGRRAPRGSPGGTRVLSRPLADCKIMSGDGSRRSPVESSRRQRLHHPDVVDEEPTTGAQGERPLLVLRARPRARAVPKLATHGPGRPRGLRARRIPFLWGARSQHRGHGASQWPSQPSSDLGNNWFLGFSRSQKARPIDTLGAARELSLAGHRYWVQNIRFRFSAILPNPN